MPWAWLIISLLSNRRLLLQFLISIQQQWRQHRQNCRHLLCPSTVLCTKVDWRQKPRTTTTQSDERPRTRQKCRTECKFRRDCRRRCQSRVKSWQIRDKCHQVSVRAEILPIPNWQMSPGGQTTLAGKTPPEASINSKTSPTHLKALARTHHHRHHRQVVRTKVTWNKCLPVITR